MTDTSGITEPNDWLKRIADASKKIGWPDELSLSSQIRQMEIGMTLPWTPSCYSFGVDGRFTVVRDALSTWYVEWLGNTHDDRQLRTGEVRSEFDNEIQRFSTPEAAAAAAEAWALTVNEYGVPDYYFRFHPKSGNP